MGNNGLDGTVDMACYGTGECWGPSLTREDVEQDFPWKVRQTRHGFWRGLLRGWLGAADRDDYRVWGILRETIL